MRVWIYQNIGGRKSGDIHGSRTCLILGRCIRQTRYLHILQRQEVFIINSWIK